jgi:hypothetical protein
MPETWIRQKIRVEVWIEKDALLGVIEGVCRELRVPYFACRGNNAQTAQYSAGVGRSREYLNYVALCRLYCISETTIPTGSMTRDNRDRLAMFAETPLGSRSVEVRRLALNMKQVEQYALPPNPAKETDSRFKDNRCRRTGSC